MRPAPAAGPPAAPTRASHRCPARRPDPGTQVPLAQPAPQRPETAAGGTAAAGGACPCHGPAVAANTPGSGRPVLTHRWWWALHRPAVRAVRPHCRTRQAGPPNTGSAGSNTRRRPELGPDFRHQAGQQPGTLVPAALPGRDHQDTSFPVEPAGLLQRCPGVLRCQVPVYGRRRGHRRVSQQLGDHFDGDAVAQPAGGRRMPEPVRVEVQPGLHPHPRDQVISRRIRPACPRGSAHKLTNT